MQWYHGGNVFGYSWLNLKRIYEGKSKFKNVQTKEKKKQKHKKKKRTIKREKPK